MRLPAVDTRTEGEREEKRREREVQGRVARVVSRPIFVAQLFAGTAPIYSDYVFHKSLDPRCTR